ncbi:hypothetical protein [Methylobacterium sp. Leaf117]|nr:hypothetical protein [Methylobacterium sp. Leaf117]
MLDGAIPDLTALAGTDVAIEQAPSQRGRPGSSARSLACNSIRTTSSTI